MTLQRFQKDPKFTQLMAAWDKHLNIPEKKSLYWEILYASLAVTAKSAAELVSKPDFKSLATPKPDEKMDQQKLWELLDMAADLTSSGP